MQLIRNKWFFLSCITGAGLFVDWLTKYLVELKLEFGHPVSIVGHYLEFFFIYNKGALFGLNPRTWFPGFPVSAFFIVFTVIAVVLLVLYYKGIKPEEKLLRWGLALVMPGAFGNLLDRIIHPEKGVVDFIKIGISETLYWPIFNFADIYITVGVVCMMIAFLTEKKVEKNKNEGLLPNAN